ncbi:MAG: GNAT family N-acetyltransferase [Actinomycetales bacterium]
MSLQVWLARDEQLDVAGRLLDAFNREYDDVTPGPMALAARLRELVRDEGLAVLLGALRDVDEAEGEPDGLVVLRFRPALWTAGLECYLAELYVVPALRGRGLGRALAVAALALAQARGADRIELGTSEDDVAARALYESLGFTNREGGAPEGPGSTMYVYERDL